MRFLILTIALVFIMSTFANQVYAQYSETISSDRPGATYSATTVGARVLQFQAGGFFINQTTPGFSSSDKYLGGGFDGSIRVGILERLEIGFPVYYSFRKRQEVSFSNNTTSELLRYGISLRGNVLKSNGKTPDIGLYAEIRFPDKETEQFTNSIDQFFLLLISQPLSERISLSSNIGTIRHFYTDLIYTLNLSVDISPSTTLFVEHEGAYRFQQDQSSSSFSQVEREYHVWLGGINGGFAIVPIPDIQIDVQAGYGSFVVGPYDSSSWGLSLGLSYRLRFKKRTKKATGPEQG